MYCSDCDRWMPCLYCGRPAVGGGLLADERARADARTAARAEAFDTLDPTGRQYSPSRYIPPVITLKPHPPRAPDSTDRAPPQLHSYTRREDLYCSRRRAMRIGVAVRSYDRSHRTNQEPKMARSIKRRSASSSHNWWQSFVRGGGRTSASCTFNSRVRGSIAEDFSSGQAVSLFSLHAPRGCPPTYTTRVTKTRTLRQNDHDPPTARAARGGPCVTEPALEHHAHCGYGAGCQGAYWK